MKPLHLLAIAALVAATGLATAQPGRGASGGPCAAAAVASGPAAADCLAPGMRSGTGRRAHWGRAYTPGWSMMSDEERMTHGQRLISFTEYGECRAYLDTHHQEMAARARQRRLAAPSQPQRDACAGLKARAR